jgi:hypothetical protein
MVLLCFALLCTCASDNGQTVGDTRQSRSDCARYVDSLQHWSACLPTLNHMDTIINQSDMDLVSRLVGFDSSFRDTVGMGLSIEKDPSFYASISARNGPWSFSFYEHPMKPIGISDNDPTWYARWNIDGELYHARYILDEDLRKQAPKWERCRLGCYQLLKYEVEKARTSTGREFIRTCKIERTKYGDPEAYFSATLTCRYQMDSAYFTFAGDVRLEDPSISIQELRMHPVMQQFIMTSESVTWW